MNDSTWRQLLGTARRVLGRGESRSLSWASESWCAWTTFTSLEGDLTYWACGLPEEHELLEHGTADGGTWMQPFLYSDIAHLIIPARFYWERFGSEVGFRNGYKFQDIESLSKALEHHRIPHRLTDRVLEVKLY